MKLSEMTLEELYEAENDALNHFHYYKDIYPNWIYMQAASDRHMEIHEEIEKRRA